jgi:hypothetical protein
MGCPHQTLSFERIRTRGIMRLRQIRAPVKGRNDYGQHTGSLPSLNALEHASEQILRHPYGLSSKLQPFELRLQLAFTGHFLLPSGASVRLTIVVICTAACSLFCSPRFRLAESRTAGASAPRSCMGTVTQITDLDSSASFGSGAFRRRTRLLGNSDPQHASACLSPPPAAAGSAPRLYHPS